MPEDRARLEIGSYGERSAEAVLQFLSAVNDSHDGLLAFLNLLDRRNRSGAALDPRAVVKQLQPRSRRLPEDYDYYANVAAPPPRRLGLRPSRRILQQLVPAEQRLEVVSIAVASPGIWAFLGALNPLAAINDFISQRHERKKDNAYRNDAERDRLSIENRHGEIENGLLEMQLVRERLDLARALGIQQEDQRLLLSSFAVRPLIQLDAVTERDMAFPAAELPEMRELDQRMKRDQPDSEPPPRSLS